MKRMMAVLLIVLVTMSGVVSAMAESSSFDAIRNDIAPNGYAYDSSFAAQMNGKLGIVSTDYSGYSYAMDRHNALIAAGWKLESVRVIEMSCEDLARMGIMTAGESSSVVIEGTKIVESFYTQPIQTKTSYNSTLLDGLANFSQPILTVVSKALPKAKWVPSAFGFATKAIVEASARSSSTFKMSSTLYNYDAQVKIEGWPYYFTCATSDMFKVAATSSHAGYLPDGTPLASSGSGSSSSQSAHYGDSAWLTAKAIECAKKGNDYIYNETSPAIDVTALYP